MLDKLLALEILSSVLSLKTKIKASLFESVRIFLSTTLFRTSFCLFVNKVVVGTPCNWHAIFPVHFVIVIWTFIGIYYASQIHVQEISTQAAIATVFIVTKNAWELT